MRESEIKRGGGGWIERDKNLRRENGGMRKMGRGDEWGKRELKRKWKKREKWN